jgi:hypothetical protein
MTIAGGMHYYAEHANELLVRDPKGTRTENGCQLFFMAVYAERRRGLRIKPEEPYRIRAVRLVA